MAAEVATYYCNVVYCSVFVVYGSRREFPTAYFHAIVLKVTGYEDLIFLTDVCSCFGRKACLSSSRNSKKCIYLDVNMDKRIDYKHSQYIFTASYLFCK